MALSGAQTLYAKWTITTASDFAQIKAVTPTNADVKLQIILGTNCVATILAANSPTGLNTVVATITNIGTSQAMTNWTDPGIINTTTRRFYSIVVVTGGGGDNLHEHGRVGDVCAAEAVEPLGDGRHAYRL